MSMTMMAFVDQAKMPTKLELEHHIKLLGFAFEFNENFNLFTEFEGNCELDGHKTYFEVHFISKESIIDTPLFLDKDLQSYDYAFSFNWGADPIAGACISIISVALMDLCNSKVVFEDFKIWYDRQELLEEIPMFIEEKHINEATTLKVAVNENQLFDRKKKNSNALNVAIWCLLIISTLLMNRKIISWYIPSLLFGYVLIKSVIDHNNANKL